MREPPCIDAVSGWLVGGKLSHGIVPVPRDRAGIVEMLRSIEPYMLAPLSSSDIEQAERNVERHVPLDNVHFYPSPDNIASLLLDAEDGEFPHDWCDPVEWRLRLV